ncbi:MULTISPECIES: hypothetical protein [Pontibacillus]|uniref:VanZ-like domain-containing protein n=1 Tax=Pontibacillus chungwhensis TaxID=265426 RepID=A0ABY8V1U8_9BACI|nr:MULTISPECIES: hypothetical protein [Pontibacillus]MCD5322487.1 hypothetical protein [Pontibacillus sp. HN14]WIF99772.1 hypothetical protein QNI29_08980 [Pontibacillus chungwhensis]
MEGFLTFDWLIKDSQLAPLGITDQHLHFFFAMVLIILFYNIVRPIIYWMILLKWDRLLSYVLAALVVLFILAFYEVYQGVSGTGEVEVRDVSNGALALICFGGFVVVTFATERLVTYIKQHKKQKPKSV